MAHEIIMPKAGIDMTEGEIVKWFKKEGDPVTEGEIILEIMTDKTSMELEAEASGILLKIIGQEGETVPVTTVIGYIGEQGENVVAEKDKYTAPEEEVVEEVPSHKTLTRLEDSYNVIVIGGGPAGYVAAIRASQHGAKVAIVEKGEFGGTCLNVGCIPTKAYLSTGEIIDGVENAAARGINFESTNYKVNMPKVVQYKNSVVKKLTSGVEALLRSNQVDIFKGIGKINKNKDVVVDGTTVIKGDKIIIAGGSKVSSINLPGIDNPNVLSSDDLLALEELPETLAVIGGGVIGIEMAQAFEALGSKVTVIEMMDRIIPSIDVEASELLTKLLKKKGVDIKTSTKIIELADKGGKVEVRLEGGTSVVADKVLVSIGRRPDIEALGEVDFEMENGKLKVDRYMETSVKGIYAPGDVNAIKMLAHVAFRMGEVAADNAVKGNHRELNLHSSPSVVYTHPEVAMVGLTEEQAREKYDVRVGRFDFVANGRAMASGDNVGFVKVIADNKYGEILGVHIVGPAAAEIINQASLIVEMEITVDEVV
ncbi:MAG: dihydrolipoyl dehydrogenase, partial [Proteiniphilum sp.]|nr:dihydrolipoyl dehydrogenase [Proteiniphilum sp.]